MIRRPTDDDLETLEPLDPDHPSFATSSSPARAVVRNPRATRRWAASVLLAVLAAASFAAAAYVRSVHGQLRDLETVWRTAVAIDADRALADTALAATRRSFGDSPGFDDKRDTLYDAADSRFTKLERELASMSTLSRPARSLHNEMVAAVKSRRSDFRREQVSTVDAPLIAEIEQDLDEVLDRWLLEPSGVRATRFTTAHEIIERLERMADEPTGLVIGLISSDGLHVIDVDANRITHRPIRLDPTARIEPIDQAFAVVSAGVVRAYDASDPRRGPLWELSGTALHAALDGTTVWVRSANQVSRLDRSGAVLASVRTPASVVLVGMLKDDGRMFFPQNIAEQFARLDTEIAVHDEWAVFRDRGDRILIAQRDEPGGLRGSPDVLRAALPTPIYDFAVLSSRPPGPA